MGDIDIPMSSSFQSVFFVIVANFFPDVIHSSIHQRKYPTSMAHRFTNVAAKSKELKTFLLHMCQKQLANLHAHKVLRSGIHIYTYTYTYIYIYVYAGYTLSTNGPDVLLSRHMWPTMANRPKMHMKKGKESVMEVAGQRCSARVQG